MTSIQENDELKRRIWQIANEVRGTREVIDIKKLKKELPHTVGKIDILRKDIDYIVVDTER